MPGIPTRKEACCLKHWPRDRVRLSNQGLEIVVSVIDIFSSLDFLFPPGKSNFKEKYSSEDSKPNAPEGH